MITSMVLLYVEPHFPAGPSLAKLLNAIKSSNRDDFDITVSTCRPSLTWIGVYVSDEKCTYCLSMIDGRYFWLERCCHLQQK